MQSRDSVPWRARTFSLEERVLSGADLDMLSERHDLDRDDLDGLAAALTVVLDQRRYLTRQELEPQQRARGQREAKAAIADLLEAEKRLARALEKLGDIAFKHPFLATGMRHPAHARLDALQMTTGEIAGVRRLLEGYVREDAITWKPPADKRKLRDERRRLVCRALFEFWVTSGRRLAYTTNPVTNEREGPLIHFVNDVVKRLTEPSAALDGDAIKVEIEGHIAAGGVTEPSGPVRRAIRVEEDLQRLLAALDAESISPAARLVQLIALRDAFERRGSAELRTSELRLAVLLSEELVARSIGTAEKGEALKELALVMTSLGELTWDMEMLQDAVAVHGKALGMLSGPENKRAWAGAQLNLGWTLQVTETLRGDEMPSPATLQAYWSALEGLAATEEPELWVQVQMSLGVALARRGDRKALAEAESHLLAALEVARSTGNARQLGNVLQHLALCQLRRAQARNDRTLLDQAKRHVDTALGVFRDADAVDLLPMAEALAREIRTERRNWPEREVPRPSRNWVKPRPGTMRKLQRRPAAAPVRGVRGHGKSWTRPLPWP